jgi:preprotein translocase subunit SecF
MEFFKIRKDIPFMRHALVFNVISLITFLLAVFFLATRGLHYSIEFTGGTVIELAYDHSAEIQDIRGALEKGGYADASVQNFGSSRDVLVRVDGIRDVAAIVQGILEEYEGAPEAEVRTDVLALLQDLKQRGVLRERA